MRHSLAILSVTLIACSSTGSPVDDFDPGADSDGAVVERDSGGMSVSQVGAGGAGMLGSTRDSGSGGGSGVRMGSGGGSGGASNGGVAGKADSGSGHADGATGTGTDAAVGVYPINCTVTNHPSTTVKVACAGDSITESWFASDPSKSYPSDLGRLLGAGWDVHNYGAGGATVSKLGDIPYWNQQKFADAKALLPNVVVLELGCNDTGHESAWADRGAFVATYTEMINTFKNLPSHPTMYSVLPLWIRGELDGYTNARLAEIIAMIKEASVATGTCPIDMNTPTLNHEELYSDRLHLNDKGYLMMSQVVCSALMDGCPRK